MILHSLEEHVLTLTLDRPKAANALNEALHRELQSALAQAAAEPQVKAIVLAAQGEKAFSAGADTREFADLPRFRAELARRQLLLDTLQRVLEVPKPMLCAIGAPAIGAGAMLALCCDGIVMADSAWMQFPEIGYDLPSPMGLALLAHRSDRALARELVQQGVRLDAAAALQHALVEAVVPRAQLQDAARTRAQALCAHGGAAYGANKAWLNRGLREELTQAAAFATEFARARHGEPLEDPR